MRRTRMRPANDHRVFTRTASKTKSINIKPSMSATGIRL